MRLLRLHLALIASLALCACQISPAARVQRARDALYDKDPKKALAEFRLALDGLEHLDTPEARVLKAVALKGVADTYFLELNDVRQAVTAYKELIAQCPEAKETLDARLTLAGILADDYHDLRAAITELTAALARNPPQSAELHYDVAKLYFQLGDFRQCELESVQLVKTFETSAFVDDALFLEAQAVAMQEGRRRDAEALFEKLPARFPDSELAPHAWFELGKLYAEEERNSEAIDAWVKALAHHPDPALVQAAIARVRRRITKNTVEVGVKAAFAKPKPPAAPGHKLTSVEAAGGTAEEAKHDYGD